MRGRTFDRIAVIISLLLSSSRALSAQSPVAAPADVGSIADTNALPAFGVLVEARDHPGGCGVWRSLWKNLQAEPFAQARGLLLDSTTVRAHQHAAGAPKKTARSRLWDALAEGSPPKSTRRPSTKTAP